MSTFGLGDQKCPEKGPLPNRRRRALNFRGERSAGQCPEKGVLISGHWEREFIIRKANPTYEELCADLGIERTAAENAIDRLFPRVQHLIDIGFDAFVVIRVLGHAFIGQLKMAGADEANLMLGENRLLQITGTDRELLGAIETASRELQPELDALHGELRYVMLAN